MAKPKGLGRGLDALLAVNHSDDQLQTLPIHAIEPGKYQPRTHMDAAALEALAESIRAQGVIQPLVVRPVGYERYELIAGEPRRRARQPAGKGFQQRLVEPGRYDITVLDDSGTYDRISLSVR